jgi:cytochrome b561
MRGFQEKYMALRNTSTEFGSLAKALHWLVAIGLFVLVYLGLEQAGMESGPEKSEIRFIHGSIAVAVFFLMTLRLVWRMANTVPAHAEGLPAWQRLTASVVHWGLYLAVFLQLLSGGMTVATGGKALPFFGIISIPLPVAKNHDSHEFWEEIHEFSWIIVAVLVVVHVLGALYNHFVAKNDVLRRMTVGLG